jgi:nickel transport protein
MMSLMKRARAIWLATVLLPCVLPASAWAHALGVQCTPRGDKVHVEAYFEDDTPAQKALVRVLDSAEEEVAKGYTDAKGLWSFDAPPPGRYQVIVDAGAGHRVVQMTTIPGRDVERASSSNPSAALSHAPTREEFTSFPWLKVALGVGTIAILAVAFMLSRKAATAASRTP